MSLEKDGTRTSQNNLDNRLREVEIFRDAEEAYRMLHESQFNHLISDLIDIIANQGRKSLIRVTLEEFEDELSAHQIALLKKAYDRS